MLYPQNGDRIVTTDCDVTSYHVMIVWAGGPTCQVDAGIALRERSLSTVSGHAEAPVVDIFSTLFARWQDRCGRWLTVYYSNLLYSNIILKYRCGQIDLLGEYSVRKGATLQ